MANYEFRRFAEKFVATGRIAVVFVRSIRSARFDRANCFKDVGLRRRDFATCLNSYSTLLRTFVPFQQMLSVFA